MVLQTERGPGAGFQQQNYSSHQESSFLSGNLQHHQPEWPLGVATTGNGASHYHGPLNNGGRLGDSEYFGGLLTHGRPNNGGRLGDSEYFGGLLTHGRPNNGGRLRDSDNHGRLLRNANSVRFSMSM